MRFRDLFQTKPQFFGDDYEPCGVDWSMVFAFIFSCCFMTVLFLHLGCPVWIVLSTDILSFVFVLLLGDFVAYRRK